VGAKVELDKTANLVTVKVTYEPITEEELQMGRVDWPKWLMREAQKQLKELRRGKSLPPQAST